MNTLHLRKSAKICVIRGKCIFKWVLNPRKSAQNLRYLREMYFT